MSSHPIDYQIIGGSFSNDEAREIWSEENKLYQQFIVEVTLAKVEGQLGVIPADAARVISQLKFSQLDLKRVALISKQKQHSLLGLIQELQRVAGDAGEYVHFGATTQDIVDTGLVLQIKSHLERYNTLITETRYHLAKLTQKYAKTPYMARTHNVHAVPITFGFVLARYLDELQRHSQRLANQKSQVLTGVFAGAVGSHSALGTVGIQVEKALMAALGLRTSLTAWHNAPDRIVSYTSDLTLLGGTLAKIGKQFYNEASTENQQILEPFVGQVGSSTMPHKRNPENFEAIAALAEPIFASQLQLQHALLSANERDAIAWKQLWLGLPEIHQYVDNQLVILNSMLRELVVNEKAMVNNVERLGTLVYAEDIMMFLAEKIGKQTAHEILFEVAQGVIDNPDRDFITELLKDPIIARATNSTELQAAASFEKTVAAIPDLIKLVLNKEKNNEYKS